MEKDTSRSARFCAATILVTLTRQQQSIKPILDRTVQQHRLPSNERNLTMQLVYGVLRNRMFLERIISLVSRTPLRKIDPFIRQALLVGLFQIFFLDRIPPSAAVNEAVESVKTAKSHKRLHGFVNGILRQAIRTKDDLQEKAKYDQDGQEILNHPDWLVHRWTERFGEDATRDFCRINNIEPTLTLRVNTTVNDRDAYLETLKKAGVSAEKGKYALDAIVLPGFSGSPTTLPGYEKGSFQIQDEAAQLATTLLGPFVKRGKYLDGCAGLGGKTSHILQESAGLDCEVHAVEPEPFRLEKLEENIARLFGSSSLVIHKASLLELVKEELPAFDGILIDAPCSGTGVIGRHPDIRWNRQEKDLTRYSNEQYKLLDQAAKLLNNGGILVYATCSLEPEENRDVVHHFLQDNSDYELVNCTPFLPDEAAELVRDGFFHPLPSHSIDGFFAARLQKKSSM